MDKFGLKDCKLVSIPLAMNEKSKRKYGSELVDEALCRQMRLKFVLEDFGELQNDATTLCCDNTSVIVMTKNSVFHQRSKHINRRYHFIRDALQNNIINLVYCKSEQLADIFTKSIAKGSIMLLKKFAWF